jgi:hypothetical protein
MDEYEPPLPPAGARGDAERVMRQAEATIADLQAELRTLMAAQGRSPDAAPSASPQTIASAEPALGQYGGPDEAAIRRAMVTAQHLADHAVAEGRGQAAQIIADAERRANEVIDRANRHAEALVAGARGSAEQAVAEEQRQLTEALRAFTSAHREVLAELDAVGAMASRWEERLASRTAQDSPAACPQEPNDPATQVSPGGSPGPWSAPVTGAASASQMAPRSTPPASGTAAARVDAGGPTEAIWLATTPDSWRVPISPLLNGDTPEG